jgi:hypothetical protein
MELAQVFDPYKIQPVDINLSIKHLYNKQHVHEGIGTRLEREPRDSKYWHPRIPKE